VGIRLSGARDVVEAAKRRIEIVVRTASRIYVSFSGGKDSLAVAGVVEELVEDGKIDPGKLAFIFVDEEAVYPDVIEITKSWRKKALLWGAQFYWLALPFRHFNCFNELTNDMSFICFDPAKEDVWVRQPPSFAVRNHPSFTPGMTYQEFLSQIKDGVTLIGLRAHESIQRTLNIERHKGSVDSKRVYPLYDWRDSDVWLYLRDRGIEFPEAYLNMYRSGAGARDMRLSQFFSIDTAKSLVRMMEFYPDLYEKILRREPNAYLAMYYWDSQMFRRSSRTRKELEGESSIDYKATSMELLKTFHEKDPRFARQIRRFIAHREYLFTDNTWKGLHAILVAGDPKDRALRALYTTMGPDNERYFKTDSKRANS